MLGVGCAVAPHTSGGAARLQLPLRRRETKLASPFRRHSAENSWDVPHTGTVEDSSTPRLNPVRAHLASDPLHCSACTKLVFDAIIASSSLAAEVAGGSLTDVSAIAHQSGFARGRQVLITPAALAQSLPRTGPIDATVYGAQGRIHMLVRAAARSIAQRGTRGEIELDFTVAFTTAHVTSFQASIYATNGNSVVIDWAGADLDAPRLGRQ